MPAVETAEKADRIFGTQPAIETARKVGRILRRSTDLYKNR
jgi:hypothetical protein